MNNSGTGMGMGMGMEMGSFLAQLRKEKNFTQVEAADRLNVSHQAISKWERGESLPDISLLPAISDLYGVSIDELVRGGFCEEGKKRAEPVKEIGREDSKETAQPPEKLENPLETAVPSAEPKLFQGTAKDLIHLSEMTQSFPSLDREAFDQILDQLENLEEAERLLPFLNRKQVGRLLDRYLEQEPLDFHGLKKFLPFVPRGRLFDLVVQILDRDSLEEAESFLVEGLPFFPQNALQQILDRCTQESHPRLFQKTAFFAGSNEPGKRDFMEKIVEQNVNRVGDLVRDTLKGVDESFTDEKWRKRTEHRAEDFQKSRKREWSLEDLDSPEEYFPRQSNERRQQMVDALIAQKEMDHLEALFPFLNREQREQAVNCFLDQEEYDRLESLFFQLGGEGRQRILEILFREGESEKLGELYHGCNREQQRQMQQYFLQQEEYDRIEELLPQMKREERQQAADILLERGETKLLEEYFSFFANAQKKKILELMLDQEEYDCLENLFPQIEGGMKSWLTKELLEREEEKGLMFLQEQISDLDTKQRGLLLEKFLQKGDADNLDELLPYLDTEQRGLALEKLLQKEDVDSLEELLPYLDDLQKQKTAETILFWENGLRLLNEWSDVLGKDIIRKTFQEHFHQ